MLAAFRLLYTSDSIPIGGIAEWLSWPIVIGGVYGSLRLVVDLLRALGRRRPPDPRAPEWTRNLPPRK